MACASGTAGMVPSAGTPACLLHGLQEGLDRAVLHQNAIAPWQFFTALRAKIRDGQVHAHRPKAPSTPEHFPGIFSWNPQDCAIGDQGGEVSARDACQGGRGISNVPHSIPVSLQTVRQPPTHLGIVVQDQHRQALRSPCLHGVLASPVPCHSWPAEVRQSSDSVVAGASAVTASNWGFCLRRRCGREASRREGEDRDIHWIWRQVDRYGRPGQKWHTWAGRRGISPGAPSG